MRDHHKAAQKLIIRMATLEWTDQKGHDNYKVKTSLATSKRSYPIVITTR